MFNLFKRKPNEIKIAHEIEKFVFDGVQNEKGIRVEDVILVMATIVACLLYTSPSPRDRG